MTIEPISHINIKPLVTLVLKLWPACDSVEEYDNYQKVLASKNEICFLMKNDGEYVAFIHCALRFDYVEGTNTSPVGYVEGIYVEPEYRKSGVGKQLLEAGEGWSKSKGCSQYASDTEIFNEDSINFHKRAGFEEVNRVVCFVKELN